MTGAARLFAAALLFAAAAAPSRAQAPEPARRVPLFEAETPLAVTLTADLGRLRRDLSGDPPWRAGTIAYVDSAGAVTLPLRLRTRGHFRLRTCAFPPLRVDFARDSVRGTAFRRVDRPKLVNVCRNDDRSEEYVLQELQLYRIYRLLTPASHRARLLRVTYVDAAEGRPWATRWAILLEEPEAMAERLGGRMVETTGARAADLDPHHTALVGVFQYLIGNTDWSIAGLHNVELVATAAGLLPVAYDFDHAGAVSASYANPPPQLPIRHVRDRLFRGYCVPAEEYERAFALLRERRDAITALYHDEIGRLLKPATVRRTLEYLDDFYRVLESPSAARRRIVEACLPT